MTHTHVGAPSATRTYLTSNTPGRDRRLSGRDRWTSFADAFDANWITAIGPEIEAFEREFAAAVGVRHAVALSSGTAALHLALHILGIRAGDAVLTSTMTSAATAYAISYINAQPVFVDVSPQTWTLDPDLLEEELAERARRGRQVRAVIAVDWQGQCADYARIDEICRRYDVALVEESADALGATYAGRPAGGFGACAAFSFAGDKIIATSGGGMLVSDRDDIAERARHLCTRAGRPASSSQRSTIGYDYRMSNLLAAVGRGQLTSLADTVARHRATNDAYRRQLADVPGIAFMPEAPSGRGSCWVTPMTIARDQFGATRDEVHARLEAAGVESQPMCRPVHLQPVFRRCPMRGGAVSERLFNDGLCLPGNPSHADHALEHVTHAIASVPDAARKERAVRVMERAAADA